MPTSIPTSRSQNLYFFGPAVAPWPPYRPIIRTYPDLTAAVVSIYPDDVPPLLSFFLSAPMGRDLFPPKHPFSVRPAAFFFLLRSAGLFVFFYFISF